MKKILLGLGIGSVLSIVSMATVITNNSPMTSTTDTETVMLGSTSLDTEAIPTTAAHEAHILWKFGYVTGSYTNCNVQLKTSYDGGTTFTTLGTGQSITVATEAVNQWDVIQVPPAGGAAPTIVQSSTSTSTALAFGQFTKFTFACRGSYGPSAAVAITAIYK